MLPLRSFTLIATLSGVLATTSCTATAQTQQTSRTPVLVELFTSEGCSSCPPADALLAKLDHDQPIEGAEIIVLGEHVDYWDGKGWNDRFSSRQYTDRQTDYSARMHLENGIYTPQMIVDGTDQFLGNDVAHARHSIQQAAQHPTIKLTLSPPSVDGRKISASVSGPPAGATEPHADLFAALVDPVDVTDVRGGENGGHHLEHVGVVRSLQKIGSMKNLAAGPITFNLKAPGDSKPSGMRVVVFAQQSGPGAVLGAVSTGVTP